ncbi:type II secretion system F family protein [Peptacetobacter hiranonis]|uniref:type II secretion system F family protein n=1 Tax=Peptacetobacter hiranonis TaxID=89152 RepID=UPI002E787862|nr:type II secretion system F family protein [Peptacetobacter hiranonis]MEE0248713.1 type II secretion system F family protein [Peptacetobacter hiranonis]
MKEKYVTWFKDIKINEFDNLDLYAFIKLKKEKSIKSKELRVMCSQMSILLESGAGIDNILEAILEQQKKKYKENLSLAVRNIKKGYSIENSFRSSDLFSEFFYNMIKCGENSGRLSNVLKDMSNYYERDYRVKSKLKSIMIYPTILLIMMIVALIFIMYAVIPNFALVFESNNIKPPLFSYLVITTMMFFKEYINILIPAIIIIISLLYIAIKSNENNIEKFDRIKSTFPILKNYYLMSVTAAFSRNMYLMLKSGIPLVEAIKISSDITGNIYIQKKLEISIRYINKGNGISKSIDLAGIFPKIFISMLKNGEESGNIEKSFQYINNFFENELDIMTDRIVRLIEPAMTIIMGFVIGALIIAIVMPMFDTITAI